MELRGQAHYTIKLFGGDLNLCRAYMPFNCYKIEDGQKINFDYKNINMVESYDKYKWYTLEDNKEWTPTDLHTQTTINAFGESIINDPHFKHYRKCGKVTNFA